MDIVKMDHIRIPFPDLLNELPGLTHRSKPMLSFEKRGQHMNSHIHIRAEPIRIHTLRCFPAAICDHAGIPILFQCMINVHRNTPNAAAAAYGADL